MLFANVMGVGDGWLGCVSLTCVWSVVVWLVIWRRVSMLVGPVF
jgi:hypothetical protein